MRDTVKIDWRVPSDEWDAFREYVQDECGGLDGYLGYEAERAMREFTDQDGGGRVEELVDRLIQASGRTPDGPLKQKTRAVDGEETTRVTVRVDSDVKDEFRNVAKDSDDTYGVYFARALNAYRDGGRFGRLERRLERIVDDVTAILSELTDAKSEDSPSVVERRATIIANNLPDQFKDDHLVDEITTFAGSSEPTIRKYRERIVERKGVEPHPNNSDLWVPTETAEQIAEDGTPRECRQPVEMLDREDRLRRIKLDLGRRAASRDSGRVSATVSDVQETIFNNEVSKSGVHDLLRAVGRDNGFGCDTSGTSAELQVNLNVVQHNDAELVREIEAYRDGESYSPSSDSPESPDAVDDEWERLEAAADGGGSDEEVSR